MAKITAIKAARGRGKRVNIFIDGQFAFSLEAEVMADKDIRVGQELTRDCLQTIQEANQRQRCLDAAARLLSYRPRSEAEMKTKLERRGFSDAEIGGTIAALRAQRLVDDAAFAQFWKENRQSFSPRSKWLTTLELRQKGIPDDVIGQTVDSIEDDDNAYRAASRKMRDLSAVDSEDFRNRLGGYLRRRGFGYGVISRTLARLKQERQEKAAF